MERVEVAGQLVAYREAGSGPPLVLLHGGLVDSRAWSREIDAFSDEFRVVAWDAPGCGQSTDPPPDIKQLPELGEVVCDALACLARSEGCEQPGNVEVELPCVQQLGA